MHACMQQSKLSTRDQSQINDIIIRGGVSDTLEVKPRVLLSSAQVAVVVP